MKRAGEVLSAIFDEKLMKKAQGYSRLFAFWAEAVQRNGIAAAADHSRIKELDRGILIIEADHPGWKQILQTKQGRLLDDFRLRFPEMDISGISLMLSRSGPETENDDAAGPAEETAVPAKPEHHQDKAEISGYEAIKDESFKESLKRLEQSIAAGERRGKKDKK